MLKILSRLFGLGIIMVCAGSACVTPTHASSAIFTSSTEKGVVLSHILPGVKGEGVSNGSSQELIAVYNNTNSDINVSGWCVANKSNFNLVCLDEGVYIKAQRYAVFASRLYVGSPGNVIDVTFDGSNKIIASSDTIYLKDSLARLVDSWSWSADTLKIGEIYSRSGFSLEGGFYSQDSTMAVSVMSGVSGGGLWSKDETEDGEGGSPGDDIDDDDGSGSDPGAVLIRADDIRITELLPNPEGPDAGAEFIELYNNSNDSVDISNYSLRVVGGSTDKIYPIPSQLLSAGSYVALYNSGIKYSLNNTAGRVEILFKSIGDDGKIEYYSVDESVYEKPKDGLSWSYIGDFKDGAWKYTSLVTPGLPNAYSSPDADVAVKVCADGQYRNPDTGRCKKVETAAAQAPCKPDQYRNPETGRCKSLLSATKLPAPCKEGQERNPETNRCRNVKKMTNVGNGMKGELKSSPGGTAWYVWLIVAIILLAVVSYALWEWRVELAGLFAKLVNALKKSDV